MAERERITKIAGRVEGTIKAGRGWYKRCVRNVRQAGGAIDPKKVCGAIKFRKGKK